MARSTSQSMHDALVALLEGPLQSDGYEKEPRTGVFVHRWEGPRPSRGSVSFLVQTDRALSQYRAVAFLAVSHPEVEEVINRAVHRKPGMGKLVALVTSRIENLVPERAAPLIGKASVDVQARLPAVLRVLRERCLPFLERFSSLEALCDDLLADRGAWPVVRRMQALAATLVVLGRESELHARRSEIEKLEPEMFAYLCKTGVFA